eukprot:363433-Chlamydomonas_euryale.AAC.9
MSATPKRAGSPNERDTCMHARSFSQLSLSGRSIGRVYWSYEQSADEVYDVAYDLQCKQNLFWVVCRPWCGDYGQFCLLTRDISTVQLWSQPLAEGRREKCGCKEPIVAY